MFLLAFIYVPPTLAPPERPTEGPTEGPTEEPTEGPTVGPTVWPTEGPIEGPTAGPTESPTKIQLAHQLKLQFLLEKLTLHYHNTAEISFLLPGLLYLMVEVLFLICYSFFNLSWWSWESATILAWSPKVYQY